MNFFLKDHIFPCYFIVYPTCYVIILQVCQLACRLLEVTSYLEEVTCNVRSLSSVLHRIAKRLLINGSLDDQDYQMIEMSEDFLQQKLFKEEALAGVVEQLQKSTSEGSERLSDKANSQSWPDFDFEQGLDEAHDLDWDTEGMELSCSTTAGEYKETTTAPYSSKPYSHSPVSETSKLSPLDSIGRLIEDHSSMQSGKFKNDTADKQNDSQIPKSTSYHGVYEEAMEMSLELEEGFYSDDDNEAPVIQNLQISQPSHHTSKISVYEVDELKTHPTSPCNYHLVSIEDDLKSMYSTDSSHHNSPLRQRKDSSASMPSTNIPAAGVKPSTEFTSLVNPKLIAEEIASLTKHNPVSSIGIKLPRSKLGRRRYNSEKSTETRRVGLEFVTSSPHHRKTVFAKMSPSLHHRHNFMSRRLPVFV